MATATARKRIDENAIITMMAEDNPKREGSAAHRRFELYADGMTVREAKAAGLLAVDVVHDEKKGFISLRPGIKTVTEEKPKKAKKAKAAKKSGKKRTKKAEAEAEAGADEAEGDGDTAA